MKNRLEVLGTRLLLTNAFLQKHTEMTLNGLLNRNFPAMPHLAVAALTQYPSLEGIEGATIANPDGVIGRFRNLILHSHYQPIISLVHHRVVGYEGLVRPRDPESQPIAPDVLFDSVGTDEDVVFLDRLARNIHVRNFVGADLDQTWLFLNVNARVAMCANAYGPYFEAMLARHGLAPHRVVIELIENEIRDEAKLAEAMRYYADLGCLVAIDDFGAGQSNFDRIWRVQPQIVKIDRKSLVQARNSARVRRVLPSLVALLHEAGCMTLIEGIEDEEDVMIALDSGVDFVQGYFFGRPSPLLGAGAECVSQFGSLCDRHAEISHAKRALNASQLNPYIEAFRQCGELAAHDMDARDASLRLLSMPNVLRCFLLDGNGRQLGGKIELPSEANRDKRFLPVSHAAESVWSRRPYFQRAMAAPGQVQISRPYFSIADARMCITLSLMIRNASAQDCVYCADILHE